MGGLAAVFDSLSEATVVMGTSDDVDYPQRVPIET
jgi:hypothetical protein